MESEWDWLNKRKIVRSKIKLRKKKEVKKYGIWKIWWKLCTTGIKRKIR